MQGSIISIQFKNLPGLTNTFTLSFNSYICLTTQRKKTHFPKNCQLCRPTINRGICILFMPHDSCEIQHVSQILAHIQYTPSVSTIKLSGPTYSSQNVRQMSDKFESQHSLSPTIWSDILVLVGHFGRT